MDDGDGEGEVIPLIALNETQSSSLMNPHAILQMPVVTIERDGTDEPTSDAGMGDGAGSSDNQLLIPVRDGRKTSR